MQWRSCSRMASAPSSSSGPYGATRQGFRRRRAQTAVGRLADQRGRGIAVGPRVVQEHLIEIPLPLREAEAATLGEESLVEGGHLRQIAGDERANAAHSARISLTRLAICRRYSGG